MPEDLDYLPCSKCGTEWAETLDVAGFPLCEQCYNTWKCGCKTGCESCVDGYEARGCPVAGCGSLIYYPDEVDCGEHVAGVKA
jgi:hypothetical protein